VTTINSVPTDFPRIQSTLTFSFVNRAGQLRKAAVTLSSEVSRVNEKAVVTHTLSGLSGLYFVRAIFPLTDELHGELNKSSNILVERNSISFSAEIADEPKEVFGTLVILDEAGAIIAVDAASIYSSANAPAVNFDPIWNQVKLQTSFSAKVEEDAPKR
jgi:hypothetical protein